MDFDSGTRSPGNVAGCVNPDVSREARPRAGVLEITQFRSAGAPVLRPVRLVLVKVPETRYVTIGDADVAYQVIGDGPSDLCWCYGLGSHVELVWDNPEMASQLTRVAALGRLIFFDRRGTGASDSVTGARMPTWEQWAEDVDAVLDAAGSSEATIVGSSDAGPIAILYAATRPGRVRSLVLANTTARYIVAEDYPAGVVPEVADSVIDMLGSLWGKPELAAATFPGEVDPERLRWFAKLARAAATPSSATSQLRYIINNLDVRHALPMIQAPTLVLHSAGNALIPVDQGRYLAGHIAGARFVEVPGASVVPIGSPEFDAMFQEVAEFVSGERPPVEIDRVLTTVLFTDIVGSTVRAAELGDQRWRSLLDAHDTRVREQLRRFRGREIKTTGDGFSVAFDGPARAIQCAQAIVDAVQNLGLSVRAGLHAGECEVRGDDLAGLSVHIAARVGALAGANEVWVSSTVKDLVIGSGINFTDRGDHELKGVPGTWKLWAVES
jgi:class 3 adenylate cyclase/pimeloyl-ACP methyl ester carboxylesterase